MIKHGDCRTKLNKVWRNMKDRCYNPNNKRFAHYGMRGISVCCEWKDDFIAFREWSYANGYKEGLSIDRINNDGNYEPSNCRWAGDMTQNNNFSRNINITYEGETHSLSVWSRILKIHRNTLDYRIKNGWSIEKAFFTKATIENRSPKNKQANFARTEQRGDAFQLRNTNWNY